MDFFEKAKIVRLRGNHSKYLYAGHDECEVFQSRNVAKKNAKWEVEMSNDKAGIRLKSCFGCYLTATDEAFLLGMTGKKVLQMMPLNSETDNSIQWEPVRDGFSVKLRSFNGSFLRANGTLPPWRNSVTHDIPHRSLTQDWVLWEVEIVEALDTNTIAATPAPASPLHATTPMTKPEVGGQEEPILSPKLSSSSPKVDGRVINYVVGKEAGGVNAEEWSQILFKGNDLGALVERLKEETGIDDDIMICTKNPLNQKLYPLRLHLPPMNNPMYVVVVRESSKMARSISESAMGSGLSMKHYSMKKASTLSGS